MKDTGEQAAISRPNRRGRNEGGIVNLDDICDADTHCVAYVKHGHCVKSFDSFGNLRPPKELIDYFGKHAIIKYNHKGF